KSYVFTVIVFTIDIFTLTIEGFWNPKIVLTAWNYKPDVFLGLSYTVITSLDSAGSMVGVFVGMCFWVWIAQLLKDGSFCGSKTENAIPLVMFIENLLVPLMDLLQILALDKSYPIVLVKT
ncbi:hypothetical protein PFISCL1PPCAC_28000, partial [Pristionchus fissidentatus]